tara:strand:- start:290 stop:496 length:207 start_codon:yes stop_codon:yes gene_type:complete
MAQTLHLHTFGPLDVLVQVTICISILKKSCITVAGASEVVGPLHSLISLKTGKLGEKNCVKKDLAHHP